MNNQNFTTSFEVDQTPGQVFDAITRVNEWWSEEVDGGMSTLNDVFDYHYQDVHIANMKLIEVVPDQKIVWLVLENQFKFTEDKTEWTGNKIIFKITQKGAKTHLQFTQDGLVPAYECYDYLHQQKPLQSDYYR
jgi:hypothetical protein